MEGKNLYTQVYEYLLTRIHTGFYPMDEPLPSIQKLSRQFHVSSIVVRGAYKMLEDNGYICGRINKRPVVLYDPADPRQKLPGKIFMDKDTLDEIHKSFDLIFPSVYYYGLSLCDPDDIEKLYQILERPLYVWDEPLSAFIAYLAGKHNNPLLMDLFYDVLLFCYPTYLAYMVGNDSRWQYVFDTLHDALKELLTKKAKGDQDGLLHMMSQAYPFGAFNKVFTSNVSDTTYQWGKPQILLSAAGQITAKILNGVYEEGSFLPSAERMAEDFAISVITMRRTIALLNDLGIVQSYNGKGTMVLTSAQAADRINWSDPVLRNNIMLYLQALHILSIICHTLPGALFPLLGEENRKQLIRQIEESHSREHAGMVIASCLRTLIYSTNLPTLRVVFDKLFGLLTWGSPFLHAAPLFRLDDQIPLLVRSLSDGDSTSFSQTLKQSVAALFQSSRAKALSVGIEAAGTLDFPYYL